MCKCRNPHQEYPEEEPHQRPPLSAFAGGVGIFIEANGEIEQRPHQHGGEGVPWYLREDLAEHEHFPTVCFCRSLASLVQRALRDEVGELLIHQLSNNTHQLEDCEHLVLQSLDAEGGVEED